MKLTWAFLALAHADDGEDKKFVNKPNFMQAETPAWWGTKTAERRNKNFFKKTFPKLRAEWELDFVDEENDINTTKFFDRQQRKLDDMRNALNKLIKDKKCGNDAVAGPVSEEEQRRRRSVVEALLDSDVSVDPIDLWDAEEAGLAPRKVKGENLKKDLEKTFSNMARYVVEEVLKTQNAKKCEKTGYKMLYRLERIMIAVKWYYCKFADKGIFPESDMCDSYLNANGKWRPGWRVNRNNEIRQFHPRHNHYTFFDWDDSKIGQDFNQED